MSRHGSRGIRNFGDELSCAVVEFATKRRVRWSPIERSDVVGVGSILDKRLAKGGLARVWGTGLRDPSSVGRAGTHDLQVLAVRGHLTRSALKLVSTPVGDPGLLARAMFDRSRPRTGVAVVPHFSDFGSRAGREALKECQARGFRIVPPTLSYHEVAATIGSASLVITSSLHGLVVSHALRTPASLVTFGPTTEPAFKYSDYMSVFGLTPLPVPISSLLLEQTSAAIESGTQIRDRIDPIIDAVNEDLLNVATSLT